jgi:UDP-N-acetylglucosamine 2-epimerase (non-hydrolysing)
MLVHPNPRVQEVVVQLLGERPHLTLLPPVDYLTMVHLMKRSDLILTDSGGIQEEAPSLGVPVLVMRDVTERPEAVEAGVVRLVGTDPESILAAARQALDVQEVSRSTFNPYGDGRAAQRIVAALLNGGRLPARIAEWQW